MYMVKGYKCHITTCPGQLSDLNKTITAGISKELQHRLNLTLYKEDMLTAIITGKVM